MSTDTPRDGRPSAPTPPEVREAAIVEEVVLPAMRAEAHRLAYSDDAEPWPSDDDLRALAAAAVAAYRATQDGGAEEAVRRVEALHVSDGYPDDPECAACRAECLYCEGDHSGPCPTVAALAPQAGDGAR